MAEPARPLASGSDVPVSLEANAAAAFDLPSGGTLTIAVVSGDVHASLLNDDRSSSTHSSLSGPGRSSITVSGNSGFHLLLASNGGAQLTLFFVPKESGGSGAGTRVISAGDSVVSSGSSSTISVTDSVIVTRSASVSTRTEQRGD